ncbi:MAG: aminomethyl-transferring glycine dehydrogenase subunit GcvPA [Pseudomonadota bacterium]|nr:aminomethyl-transferring glycine dehydrogenase subunit GcvPA [Pseudomonadota bacterium]
MPFVPHTESDVQSMLKAIGAKRIDDLFDEIPESLRIGELAGVPAGLNEMEVGRLMRERAAQDGVPLCFAGAGAYDHHIPAAVWAIVTRGEFYSAYTPYQAEASQGTLQLIYEFQTAMTRLTGLDVSNASMYDGASALAEAVLMAERARKKGGTRRVVVPSTVHPAYRKVMKTILGTQQIELVEVAFDAGTGKVDPKVLAALELPEFTALVIPQPNYFGVLEDVDALTDWAHARGALVIAVVNPVALAVLKAPGRWGQTGVDIACGDGQPLGVPMSSGGPYFGFFCCKLELVRNMPGRIVGRTTDLDGREGFTLTLQAREQHIRRAKATSNICTNQGLLVTAATIYMAMVGAEGLRRVAAQSAHNTRQLRDALCAIDGVRQLYSGVFFHEVALQLSKPARVVIDALASRGLLAGVAVGDHFPGADDVLLVCATECRTAQDITKFANALRECLQ